MYRLSRRAVLVGASALLAGPSYAQQKKLRVGVLTDLSGIFADLSGAGSVLAANNGGRRFWSRRAGVFGRRYRC